MILDEFIWRFAVDNGQLITALRESGRQIDAARMQMDKLTDGVQQGFSAMRGRITMIRNALAAAGIATALNYIKDAALGAASNLDRINDVATRIGASAANVEAFGKAAQLAGSSKEAAEGLLKRISDEMGRGGEALEDIGVAIIKTDGSMRDVFDVAADLSDALAKMGPQAAGAFLHSLRVTDDSLINLVSQGSSGLNAAILASRKSEADMDERQKSSARLLTAWRKFESETLEGKIGNAALDGLAAVIEHVNDLLTLIPPLVDDLTRGAKEFTADLIVGIANLVDGVSGFLDDIKRRFPDLWNAFHDAFMFAWRNITAAIETGLSAAKSFLTGDFSGAWDKAKRLFTGDTMVAYGQQKDTEPPSQARIMAGMAASDAVDWAKKVQAEASTNPLNNVNNVSNQITTDNSRKQSTNSVINRNNTTINIDARGAEPKAVRQATKDGVLDADRLRLQQQTGLAY